MFIEVAEINKPQAQRNPSFKENQGEKETLSSKKI
jgi:hypothetical protein